MIVRNLTSGRGPVTANQADRLAPAIQVRTTGIDSFGSVATQRGYSSNARRMPSSFTAVFDNSASVVARVFVVGDSDGMIAGKTGATYIQPTRVQGTSVAALQNSFRSAGVLVSGFNYNTTTGSAQFSQNFQFAEADYDKLNITDIFSVEAERNTAQNPNLLTIQFKDPFELDWNSAFLVTVDAGEIVTLTAFIGAASGR